MKWTLNPRQSVCLPLQDGQPDVFVLNWPSTPTERNRNFGFAISFRKKFSNKNWFGSQVQSIPVHSTVSLRCGFHDLELKVKFLAAEDIREIELPELSCKTKSRPAVVKVGYPFETQHAPEICQADVSVHWS